MKGKKKKSQQQVNQKTGRDLIQINAIYSWNVCNMDSQAWSSSKPSSFHKSCSKALGLNFVFFLVNVNGDRPSLANTILQIQTKCWKQQPPTSAAREEKK